MPKISSKLPRGDGHLTSALYKTTLWVKKYEGTLKMSAHPPPPPYVTD